MVWREEDYLRDAHRREQDAYHERLAAQEELKHYGDDPDLASEAKFREKQAAKEQLDAESERRWAENEIQKKRAA